MGRSSWGFLQDFYLRVETAENHAQMLERELYESQSAAHQCHTALLQCESSLSACWEVLNKERLNHRASREALASESERHKETMRFLERMSKEAIRSGEIADILSNRLDTALGKTLPRSISTLEQSAPTKGPELPSAPPGPQQTATRGCSTDLSDSHQQTSNLKAKPRKAT